MFHVITGLIALLVVWRVVWPLRCTRATRCAIAVLVLLVSRHHLITRGFFGSMASPEIPVPMRMPLGWGFGAVLPAACLELLADLSGALAFVFKRAWGHWLLCAPRRRGGIAVLAMVLAAVGEWEAVRVPAVRTVELELPRWPAALDGLRVVQITDPHASRLPQRPVDGVGRGQGQRTFARPGAADRRHGRRQRVGPRRRRGTAGGIARAMAPMRFPGTTTLTPITGNGRGVSARWACACRPIPMSPSTWAGPGWC